MLLINLLQAQSRPSTREHDPAPNVNRAKVEKLSPQGLRSVRKANGPPVSCLSGQVVLQEY
jgi:hypothetical protein